MKAIILRGISGSGKSTFCKENWPDATVCSADNFFMRDGEYCFNPTLLGKAHAICLAEFIDAINNRHKIVVADNTFIHKWEYMNYIQIADAKGYEIEICRTGTRYRNFRDKENI